MVIGREADGWRKRGSLSIAMRHWVRQISVGAPSRRSGLAARDGQAVGMIERLGETEAFLAVGDPLLELSPVAENPGQMTASHHGGKSGEAKAFPAQITFKQRQDFEEKSLCPSIVARAEAGQAEVEISRHLERNIPKRLGNNLGVPAERERFRRMTRNPEVVAQIDRELPDSPLIGECPRQTFGFAETTEDPLEFSERKQ